MKITCVWHNKGEKKRKQLENTRQLFFLHIILSCNHAVKVFILFVSNRALKVSSEQGYVDIKNRKKAKTEKNMHKTVRMLVYPSSCLG